MVIHDTSKTAKIISRAIYVGHFGIGSLCILPRAQNRTITLTRKQDVANGSRVRWCSSLFWW